MEKYQPKKKKNPINLRSKLKLIILLCILFAQWTNSSITGGVELSK